MKLLTGVDLKLDNIMLTFENSSVLPESVKKLEQSTIHFKESHGRRVFESHHDFGPLASHVVVPKIADFGLAQLEDDPKVPFAHPIQTDSYRAPEVLLGGGWSYSADIWNMGAMVSLR
jgi:serine/threonine protein kinase